MAEYINREEVLNDIGELFTICYETLPNECGHHFIVEKELETHLDFVRNLPIVDIQPVVHGKWINDSDGLPVCSECGEIALQRILLRFKQQEFYQHFVLSNYCPKCGAKMDGE